MKTLLFLVLLCSASLYSGTVRLYNDSSYKLRTVIRGADGTYLGEMVILPESMSTWSDQSSFGPGGSSYVQSPNTTMTPYVIHWICLDGDEFGINTNIPTGGAAIAESSTGPRYCKPPKKKKPESPYGPQAEDEKLYHQNQTPKNKEESEESQVVD